ncbi:unnamed protein product [Paramecium octaurelia]|uniref:Uncharacterized protein n=1 Tax=Paramecium octaurelia TaxID=43137 RepID=A0A8S1YG48_PAROT|nr:unnamed protein product [Paramecium octaurelia]
MKCVGYNIAEMNAKHTLIEKYLDLSKVPIQIEMQLLLHQLLSGLKYRKNLSLKFEQSSFKCSEEYPASTNLSQPINQFLKSTPLQNLQPQILKLLTKH